MTLIPKRELLDDRLHIAISVSDASKLQAFADDNGVNKSEAARWILTSFLATLPDNPEATPPKKPADLENFKARELVR